MNSAMNFPVWDLGGLNGGLLIAVIAVIHVFVAQFAVGGGFFLAMAERKGHREGSHRILAWVQKHTRFFLLLTMVFGSITGVGIWLIISLTAPAGVSLLIREFAFAWAAEWVFFLGEIVTLLLYSASFPRTLRGEMAPRDHMLLALGYALFAFLSLFVINGIVSFMLTPGDWLQTRSFWSALFNPTFWPALVFRFSLSLCLAGMFGLITACGIRHDETRESMIRFCAQWICLPFVLMVLGSIWYAAALPEDVRILLQRGTSDIRPFIRSFLDASPILFLAGMFLFISLPRKAYIPYVAVVLALGLVSAGSFEFIRETARRPWLIYGHMYSNGLTVDDGKRMNAEGILATSGWARLRAGLDAVPVTPDVPPLSDGTAGPDATEATLSANTDNGQRNPPPPEQADGLSPSSKARFARFIYTQQCSSCHGLGGPRLDLLPRIKGRGVKGVAALLAAQGSISAYMPPFFGSDKERLIFAEWLAGLEQMKTKMP